MVEAVLMLTTLMMMIMLMKMHCASAAFILLAAALNRSTAPPCGEELKQDHPNSDNCSYICLFCWSSNFLNSSFQVILHFFTWLGVAGQSQSVSALTDFFKCWPEVPFWDLIKGSWLWKPWCWSKEGLLRVRPNAPTGSIWSSRSFSWQKKINKNCIKIFKFVSCEVKILLKVLICRIFDCWVPLPASATCETQNFDTWWVGNGSQQSGILHTGPLINPWLLVICLNFTVAGRVTHWAGSQN